MQNSYLYKSAMLSKKHIIKEVIQKNIFNALWGNNLVVI
jgi:hypothetical protein